MSKLKSLLPLFLIVFFGISCKQNNNAKNTEEQVNENLEVEIDTSSRVVKFENTLFSIPSPHQLSILIKDLGANFNSELLNPYENHNKYTGQFKQAINLGIYGADLAYLNIYEQFPSAINYFSVIKMMAQELDLSAAFKPEIFKRIEKNIDKQDSLLFIMSNLYSDVDLYLKEAQRQREGVLILAGGWIEASHFLTNIAKETNNEKMIQRIGENKQSLDNLIKLLTPYYSESEDIAKLSDDLVDLFYEFDAIETEYEFIEPTTYPAEKLTQIHSKSRVILPKEVLANIQVKIENIRNSLIK